MTTLDRSSLALAVALSALAGYVDALGFITLGGYFVSFMSGNSTQIGVDAIKGGSLLPLLLIGGFVAGVFLGSLIGHAAGMRRRPVALALVTVFLLLAAISHAAGIDAAAVAGMVLAMGLENTIFEETAAGRFGLTYVTGSLVKMGERLAQAVRGGPRWDWFPYFLLWSGLVLGAIAGAASFAAWKLQSLWLATAFAAALSIVAACSLKPVRKD